MTANIICLDDNPVFTEHLRAIAKQIGLECIRHEKPEQASGYILQYNQQGQLQIRPVNKKQGGPLLIDFCDNATQYKLKTFGIRQDLPKAIGCKPGVRPSVLDATAGLGGDAFVLAALGCNVAMSERNPIVHALLKDALDRLEISAVYEQELKQQLTLLPCKDTKTQLSETEPNTYEVVYLDPMFPSREKSAKVKKGMQYFHDIIGFDEEQNLELWQKAMQVAEKRVVVKRPKGAPLVSDKKPSFTVEGKLIRYDVYVA